MQNANYQMQTGHCIHGPRDAITKSVPNSSALMISYCATALPYKTTFFRYLLSSLGNIGYQSQ